MSPAKRKKSTDPLVGRWFHSFTACKICGKPQVSWQGHIVAVLPSGAYLVQLFEWILGQASEQKLVRVERMEREQWCFYDDDEYMTHAYRQTWERRHETCHRTAAQDGGR
jgi:hypothetical protein